MGDFACTILVRTKLGRKKTFLELAEAEATQDELSKLKLRLAEAEKAEDALAKLESRLKVAEKAEGQLAQLKHELRKAEAAQGADSAEVDRLKAELAQAETARGEADALRNNIFAEAFGQDPEFFEFYRSLTAYERALQGSNSTMVITPDSEFFDYLGGSAGRP